MNKKMLTILAILLLLVPTAVAINYPQLTGYVTDNANIIDSEYEQKITDLADRINKATTVEIAVLTIESLEGDDPENYAVNTFRQNGVGKKDNNNGLLILVSKNDRKYRFEVGYGLEGTIPDAMKVPIGDKIITPNFKNGDYGKGIYESMLVIEGLATNNTEVLSKYGMIQNKDVPNESGGDGSSGIFIIIVLVTIGIFAVIFFFMIRDSNRGSYSSPSPSLPITYKPPPYTRSSGSRSTSSGSSSSSSSSRKSSSSRSSSYNYGGSSRSHSHSSGGFGGFGGGKSGGGGFGGGW